MDITAKDVAGLSAALAGVQKITLPIKTAYWLARAHDKVEKAQGLIEERREEIIKKYVKRDEDGNMVSVDGVYEFTEMDAANAEYEKLMNEDIDLDIKPFKLEDFGERTELSSEVIKGLLPILTE